MSQELDDKIDGLTTKLVEDAKTRISMSNGQQKLRTAQEIALGILKVTKALNEDQEVTDAKLAELEKQLEKLIAESEGAA